MQMRWMIVVSALWACDSTKRPPSSAADAVVAANNTRAPEGPGASLPVQGDPPPPEVRLPVEGCAPAGAVVLTKTSALIQQPDAPEHSLSVYENGYWKADGLRGTSSGCLTPDEAAALRQGLASVSIAAEPLPPGTPRCMALPISTVTVRANDQSATWEAPCGDASPSKELGALLSIVDGATRR